MGEGRGSTVRMTMLGVRLRRPITAVVLAGDVAFLMILSSGLTAMRAAGADEQSNAAERAISERVIWTQVPTDRGTLVAGQGADVSKTGLPAGSRVVLYDPGHPSSGALNLTPEFAAAGHVDLSFDGERILFVGRRDPGDAPCVWELELANKRVRRVTGGEGHCERAIYLSTLYTMEMERPVHRIAFQRAAEPSRPAALYTCQLDGMDVTRITYSPQPTTDPFLLRDGRLVFCSWTPSGGGPAPREERPRTPDGRDGGSTSLLTVHVDGTGLFPFAAMHEPSAVRTMPCQADDGSVIYVESSAGYGDSGGRLMAVDSTRSLRTRSVIADDPDGLYHSPSSAGGAKLLVSHRPKTGGSYGVYVLDRATGERLHKVYDDPAWHDVGAHLVRPRPEPAGRSSVVKRDSQLGRLYCLNAYLTDRPAGGDVSQGEIRRIRVIRGALDGRADRPASNDTVNSEDAGAGGASRSSGQPDEAPVETDGSFFLEVPARTPLRLETLDGEGAVLQSMGSWMWVMPNERRGCIGCHEDRELTPPNRHVAALRNAPWRIGSEDKAEAPAGVEARNRSAYPK